MSSDFKQLVLREIGLAMTKQNNDRPTYQVAKKAIQGRLKDSPCGIVELSQFVVQVVAGHKRVMELVEHDVGRVDIDPRLRVDNSNRRRGSCWASRWHAERMVDEGKWMKKPTSYIQVEVGNP